jgi:hypothetical protein
MARVLSSAIVRRPKGDAIKALTFQGPGQRSWEEMADPRIQFATHTFALEDTMAAYDTFADAANTQALKGVLEADRVADEHVEPKEALVAHSG